jgi:hypothetical protein
MTRHPNKRQLQQWMDGEADELDPHVDSCEKCARTLDELAGNEADLRPALLTLLAPPADLQERITDRIASRVQDRQDMALFSSLLGVGVETGKIVFEPGSASQ